MSKSNWRNGFTVGIAVGLLSGIMLVLALNWSVDPTTSGNSGCGGSPNNCANNGESLPDWRYWFRRFFAMEDSLAQWIMMIFTVAAAGLLLFTLRATQRMANDADRFGRSQTRAFIAVKITSVVVEAGKPFSAIVKAQNCGATPALGVRILASVQIDKPVAIKHTYTGPIDTERSEVGSFVEPSGHCHITLDTENREILSAQDVAEIRGGSKIIRGLIYIPYKDIFDNQCWTRRDFEISGDYAVSTGNVIDISHGPNSDCG